MTATLSSTPKTASPPVDRASLERELVAMLATGLGLTSSEVDPALPFLEMGASSLVLVDLFRLIDERFGVRPSMRKVFEEHANVVELAAYVEQLLATAPAKRLAPPPAAEHSTLPLTGNQRQIWFLSRYSDAAAAAYTTMAVSSLTGRIDEARLREALAHLSERHDALRFTVSGSEELSHLHAELAPVLLDVDLDGRTERERLRHLAQSLRAIHDERFDEEGCPARLFLYRLDEERAFLVLAAAEIVIDRNAAEVLLAELGELYSAAVLGRPADLPAPFSYQRYIAENVARESETTDGGDFWTAPLGPTGPFAASRADLPTDRPRPAFKSYAGSRLSRQLDAARWRAVEQLGADLGCGTYAVLSGAFSLWLSRMTSATHLVVGTEGRLPEPSSGRLVGNRINPLALSVAVDPSLSVEGFLEAHRDYLLATYDHQAYPFASLIQALSPARDESRSPLFVTSFTAERAPEAPRFAGLSVEVFVPPIARAKYDIEVRATYSPKGLQVVCDYATDLFDAETIRGWLDSYLALLEDLGPRRARPVSELSALSAAQRHHQLYELSGRAARTALADDDIITLLRAELERSPDAPAVSDANETLSYRELHRAANRVARELRERGAVPGSLVGIALPRDAHLLVAVIGTLAAGCAYVPLDPSYPRARLELVLGDAKPAVLISNTALAGRFPSELVPTTLLFDRDAEAIAGAPSSPPEGRIEPTDLAYVFYTSGSTGRPKGVGVEHRQTAALLAWARSAFSAEEVANTLFSTSLSFDLSVFEMLLPLVTGGRVVIVDNALSLLEQAPEQPITLLNLVPSAMRELLRAGVVPPSVKCVGLGGEAVPREIVRDTYRQTSAKRVLNLYGPTECTTYSTVDVIADDDGPITIGRPITNSVAYVLDARGRLCPPGAVGELCLGGAGVARGYLGDQERTSERFVTLNLDGETDERLYRTGDLVRWRADGRLSYLGRSDQQVKVRGHRIELTEIEGCLRAHEHVEDAVVSTWDDAEGSRTLVAYIVSRGGVDADALREHLGAQLPAHAIPSRFVALTTIPLLPNGKTDRSALPPPQLPSVERRHEIVAPQNSTERVLHGIWCEVLEIADASIHDDFFALGGHSLLLTRLLHRVWKDCGARLSMRQFFAAPTIAGVAKTLFALRERRPTSDVRYDQASAAVQERFAFLYREAELAPELSWSGEPYVADGPPRSIFMTGATGFVGGFVVQQLLERSDAELVLLTRCDSPEHGRERVRAGLERFGLWRDDYAKRIQIARGALDKPRLGMSDADYERFAARCDLIFHNGAYVNFIYPYEPLAPTNVEGTRSVIAFAFHERLKPVHYVSSIAVLPMGGHRRFEEENSLDHRLELNMAYDDTKWVSEVMLRHARERGLPSTVYRPGEVSGHSDTGLIVPGHFMYAVVAGSLQQGLMPLVDCFIDFTPVDYAAAAMAHLTLQPQSLGHTFHVVNPEPIHSSRAFDWARSVGYEFELLPFAEWRDAMLQSPDFHNNALYPYASVLDDFYDVNFEFPELDCQETLKALEDTDIRCHPVDDQLLRTYWEYFVADGYWPSPKA